MAGGRIVRQAAGAGVRVRNVALVGALYAVVIFAPAMVGLGSAAWLGHRLGDAWWIVPAAVFAFLALAAPLAYLAVEQRIESRTLRAQRRYHRTLISASSGMTRIKEIRQLCQLITHVVNRTVGLTNSGLFLYDPKEQRYSLQAARYRSLMPAELSLDQRDPLVELLQAERDLIRIEDLQEWAEGRAGGEWMEPAKRKRRAGRGGGDRAERTGGEWATRARAIYEWMRKLEARLVVPSFSNERLLGFLLLGGKRSGRPYTTDDVAIFAGLANQAALAIENAIFFDELRTNEAYMVQSEKLASLGQLASGMAHEIHNPLTIISGEAQLYLERFKTQDQKVDDLLKSIIEECKRAADITRRILRFAKPAPTDVSPVDLKATVEESLTLAGYQVRLEHVERTVHMPDNLPKVRSNQNQLQEVVLNLILNACQAMGEKGGKLDLSATANGGSVVLTVTDTGPGIPPNVLRKVFDPFYTTKATGTGLGLFVSQRIIKSHGGSIELESTVGKGTRFTIRLPVWQDGGRGAGASASGAAAGAGAAGAGASGAGATAAAQAGHAG